MKTKLCTLIVRLLLVLGAIAVLSIPATLGGDELKKAGKKTRADQLRSIIKEDEEAAIREYMRMTGKEGR